jgi:predicted TPR repeat methyltransferase
MSDAAAANVDDAVALAVEWLKAGRALEAAEVFRRALQDTPEHADALHYLGMALYQQECVEDAIAFVRRSIEQAPRQSDWHSNLGIMLLAHGDVAGAIGAFRTAIELTPTHAAACNNLGVLLRAAGQLTDAEAAYRAAIAAQPEYADAYHNLAIVLHEMGRTADAAIAHYKELTLRPGDSNAWRHLALAYCHNGDPAKAEELCRQWLARCPDDPQALHTLAACSARHVPPRASDAYIEQVFDNFADSFEAKLARLHYHAPALVAAAIAADDRTHRLNMDVLDLGCGTGLCGPFLAPYARRLVGVDLSRGMLQHAAAKGVYHELIRHELTGFLQQTRAAWDIIVAADTLVYFGELEPVITAAANALRPGGVLVFTVEHATDPGPAFTYALQPHGRYVHSESYIRRLADASGLECTIRSDELRQECGAPVDGLVVRAIRRSATSSRP